MTDEQIEELFSRWYDARKGMPPAAWESFKAGWEAALNRPKKMRPKKIVKPTN